MEDPRPPSDSFERVAIRLHSGGIVEGGSTPSLRATRDMDVLEADLMAALTAVRSARKSGLMVVRGFTLTTGDVERGMTLVIAFRPIPNG